MRIVSHISAVSRLKEMPGVQESFAWPILQKYIIIREALNRKREVNCYQFLRGK